MKTLRFVVKDKRITRQDCFTVVDGVVNQYEFQLRFDSDWDGLTKTVVWENGDVKVELLYTGGLILPWEVCKEGALLLSVNGSKTLGDGRTQIVRTARMTRPIQVVPHGSESGEKPGEFTPELAQQVLAVLGDLAALLTTNKSTMVAAINEIYQEAGIESIRFKETDAEGNNVYTVNLSRGESYEIKAPIGKTGPQGAQGIKGDTGQKGDKGDKGEKGDRGEKGDTGATGAKGETGATGATGPQGETGPRGPQGLQGIQGEPGKGLTISGYYATAQALAAAVTNPEAGDAYGVGTSEPYDIYIYDGVTHAWVNNGPLQGAKGEKGDTGAKGDPGKDGSPGAAGAPGATGTTFTPSVSADGTLSWTNDGGKTNPASVNIKGPQGAQGPKGDTGAKGETGATGPQGPKGDTGAAGPQGPAGHTPVKGTDYFTSADKNEIAQAAAELVEVFLVTLTTPDYDGGYYDSDVTADKSFAEIFAAYQNGEIVQAKWNSWILDLVDIGNDYARFAACRGAADTETELYSVTAICTGDIADQWEIGCWRNNTPSASTTAPKAPGTASAGSESAYARGDHVHPKQTVTKSDVGLGNVDNVSINTRLNRTTNVHAADTNYTKLMARGESLNAAEVTPAVNGAIAWVYG